MAALAAAPTNPIRSVERVCDILNTLASARAGATLTEVARATDLPKSSALRYLAALEVRHYVDRDTESGTYRLGAAVRAHYSGGKNRPGGGAPPRAGGGEELLGDKEEARGVARPRHYEYCFGCALLFSCCVYCG